jgi:hypothetical protein
MVDHLVDWARDTFRPSVIAQLCLEKEEDFDNLTLGPDSDILSKRRVTDWMSNNAGGVPPTQAMDSSLYDPLENDLRDPISSKKLPITAFGTVKSVIATSFQLVGLRITEDNVESLLPPDVQTDTGFAYNGCARKLINEITRWDEVLVVLGADLDYLEHIWTGNENVTHDPFGEGPGTEYYSVFQYRCFINCSWEIVRELNYMAISPGALDLLRERAAFQKRHEGIEAFSGALRQCPGAVFRKSVDCLRSGSLWQVLQMALRSTLVFMTPEPAKKRADSVPPVEYLGFAYTREVHVILFIKGIMQMNRNLVHSRTPASVHRKAKRQKTQTSGREAIPRQNFWRFSERLTQSASTEHVASQCERCEKSGHDFFNFAYAVSERAPFLTAYGAMLVVSLKYEREDSREHQTRYDVCLFVYDGSLQDWDELSFVTVVEDLAQDEFVHHTIRHDPNVKEESSPAVLWNLPSPYRKNCGRRRLAIYHWIQELGGDNDYLTPSVDEISMHLWVHEQMLLHYLDQGMSYQDATLRLKEFRDNARRNYWNGLPRADRADRLKPKKIPADCVRLGAFWGQVRTHSDEGNRSIPTGRSPWLPARLQIRGGQQLRFSNEAI